MNPQELSEQLIRYKTNPATIQQHAIDQFEKVYGGEVVFSDASNPLVHVLEFGAVLASAGMSETEMLTRRQYPSMALSLDDVYRHMSDRDFIDMFATPGSATFTLLFLKDEIYRRAVVENNGPVRRLTIPRNTSVTIGDLTFTMQYPIDIRIMSHGGLQVTYDTSIASPLQVLDTNIVNWKIARLTEGEFLAIDIPMQQFQLTRHNITGTLSEEIVREFDFPSNYYFARVWSRESNGEWRELKTTHSQQVFDPMDPTALLQVTGNRLRVTIPSLYTQTYTISTVIRVDIYTTEGPIDLLLSNLQTRLYNVQWADVSVERLPPHALGPISFDSRSCYAMGSASGGTNPLSFEEIRERVLLNAIGTRTFPISNLQLEARLQRAGYSSVKDLDYVTRRDYLATRELPAPTDGQTITGIGSTIERFSSTMTALSRLSTVRDNGNRLTVLPETLYEIQNGLVSVVPQLVVDQIKALSPDLRARRVNESSFLYTPFHYVLDSNDGRFSHRPYYLENPQVLSKSFVSDNDSIPIQVTAASLQLTKEEWGYDLYVLLNSGDEWKELEDERVHVQLSFRPHNERDRCYLDGTLLTKDADGNRMYLFRLETNYDIDAEHYLHLSSMRMYGDGGRLFSTALTQEFDLLYSVTDPAGQNINLTEIDGLLSTDELPPNTRGVTHEKISLNFGTALNGLRSTSRTSITEEDYAVYEQDVLEFFETPVYARDPVTNIPLLEDDGNGGLQFVIVHNVGDPVLDEFGVQKVKHRAGSIRYDNDGQPIVLATRTLLRQIDLLFFDGKYYFADSAPTLAYSMTAPQTLIGWLQNEIDPLRAELLEQTSLYFQPKSTLGMVPVIVGEGRETVLESEQSFAVTYYLTGNAYRDTELRNALTQMAIRTIDEQLRQPVVTLNGIYSQLSARAGTDVVGLEVTGLGGIESHPTITMRDNSARLSIRKRAVQLPDNTIAIEDDVAVSFIQHVDR